jgi:hypothetical protein
MSKTAGGPTLLTLPQDVHLEIIFQIPSLSSLGAFILTHRTLLESFKENLTFAVDAVAENQFGDVLPVVRSVSRDIFSPKIEADTYVGVDEIPGLLRTHEVANELENIFAMLEKTKR